MNRFLGLKRSGEVYRTGICLWDQRRPGLFFCGLIALGTVWLAGCSIFASRPVQEMSYALASIKAAKEVQADVYAPELFRLANEWFFKAKNEYKYKNFELAKEYADQARKLAEQSEFESIRSGATRSELAPEAPPPSQSPPSADSSHSNEPAPRGTPIESYDERKAAENAKAAPPAPSTPPAPAPATAPPTNP